MKKRNWIIGCVTVVMALCLAACTKAPAGDQASIVPLPRDQYAGMGSPAACRFQYTQPESSQRVALSVETWRDGQLVDTQPLFTLEESGTYSAYARQEGETELLWCIDRLTEEVISNEAYVITTPGGSGAVFAGLTKEDAKLLPQDTLANGGMVLFCLSSGDMEGGIPAVDCVSLTKDESPIANESAFDGYEEIQLIRAVLTDEAPIVPLAVLPDEDQPATGVCGFQYTQPESSQRVALELETWRDGQLVDTQPLVTLEESGTYAAYARRDGETDWFWGVDRLTEEVIFNVANLTTTSGSSTHFSSRLTEDAVKTLPRNALSTGGLVLFCLGSGDPEPSMFGADCATLSRDDATLAQYQEAQLIRAVLTDEAS